MKPIAKHGAEQARKQFPRLVEEAARGHPTLITKHGRPYAAIVSADSLARGGGPDLLTLRGTGKGLWGKSIRRSIDRMRDEWR